MAYKSHYVGLEDQFPWEEPAPEKDAAELEKLFTLEPEQPQGYGAGLVDGYLRSRVEDAGLDVHQLQDEIVSRRRMLDRQLGEIDYQISRAAWSLKQLDFRVGYNSGIDFKRNWTERELANLRRERRSLKLRCWEDIVTLRRQLREAVKQYRDSAARKELMGRDPDGS
jgi:hypothetical protein